MTHRSALTDGAGAPGTGAGAVGVHPVVVHRVGPEDWVSHRDLRLAMLRADPDAFWARADEIAAWDEQRCRSDAAGPRLHLQARRGGEVLGGIGLLPEGYTPQVPIPEDCVHLVSMWVRPTSRGQGISDRLLDAAAELALELGRPRLLLDVDARNLPAQRFYGRRGFRPTGVTDPRDGTDSHWVEHEAAARELIGPGG
ncbi:GNAT family N-acetyltransferase [Brachybacterium sp. AOP43-C2-M15]|uniref:GNAT family N-acetyltransferase n=1 Tax=Brachybacterium sp. AOP43-C2-M15 TaxID=3457661 RepID=UPI00403325F0